MGSKNFKFVFGQLIQDQLATTLVRKERLNVGKEVSENHGIVGRNKLGEIEKALSQFVQYCRDRNASTVLAIATSAIRNARNCQQIIELADEVGVSMEIANGEREGEVGYLAATGGVPNKLVSDSGSKSTQIAWDIDGDIVSRSIPVGYELAYESFFRNSASFDETRDKFSNFLSGNFKVLAKSSDQYIALAANTITTFVTGKERSGPCNRILNVDALERKMSELQALSPSQYENLKSSLPNAEKALPGLVLLSYLMACTGHREALVVEAELPVGLVLEYFRQ